HAYALAVLNHAWALSEFRTVARIKARSPRTQVIVMGADTTRSMERMARDAGAFDFLEKPFDLDALADAVECALLTPERRRGPRGCCAGCAWQRPCERWH
ncbi:MAG: response regulator, partial [Acidobacteria bacterium]